VLLLLTCNIQNQSLGAEPAWFSIPTVWVYHVRVGTYYAWHIAYIVAVLQFSSRSPVGASG